MFDQSCCVRLFETRLEEDKVINVNSATRGLIVDPPRKGLDNAVLKALIDNNGNNNSQTPKNTQLLI
jgi:hypothetical protein